MLENSPNQKGIYTYASNDLHLLHVFILLLRHSVFQASLISLLTEAYCISLKKKVNFSAFLSFSGYLFASLSHFFCFPEYFFLFMWVIFFCFSEYYFLVFWVIFFLVFLNISFCFFCLLFIFSGFLSSFWMWVISLLHFICMNVLIGPGRHYHWA